MNLRINFLICILLLSKSWIQVQAQDPDYGSRIIRDLTSPEMAGRGYVKAGSERAATYVLEEMKAIGLQPLDGAYEHGFLMPANTFPGPVNVSINGQKLIPGREFMISPGSPALKGEFNTFEIGLQDILKIGRFREKAGKHAGEIAVFDHALLTDQPDSLNRIFREFENFFRHDSLTPIPALIVLNTPRLMWSVAQIPDHKPLIRLSAGLDVRPIRKSYIEIRNAFIPDYRSGNVFGSLPGDEVPDSLLVFTAHYDHLGMMGQEAIFPGANDNASGVALMLDLARHFSEKDERKYTMVFIGFGAEEAGLLGSLHFINDPPFDLRKIRFLINLDLAGTGDEGITVVNGSIFMKAFRKMQEINTEHEYLPSIKSRGEACNSDHCPFYRIGVPCFLIYTRGGIQAYHDLDDRYETLPLTAYENYFRLLVDFVDSF